jgi:hypothetical protein
MGGDGEYNGAIEIIQGFETEMHCNLSKNMIRHQITNKRIFNMNCVEIIKEAKS